MGQVLLSSQVLLLERGCVSLERATRGGSCLMETDEK